MSTFVSGDVASLARYATRASPVVVDPPLAILYYTSVPKHPRSLGVGDHTSATTVQNCNYYWTRACFSLHVCALRINWPSIVMIPIVKSTYYYLLHILGHDYDGDTTSIQTISDLGRNAVMMS